MHRTCVLAAIVIGALLVGTANASTILGSATWDANGHTYYLVEFGPGSSQTWDTARADVESMFGSGIGLASITSSDEDVFVRALLAGRGFEWWVGAFQEPISEPNPNAGWTWVTREPFVYTNWCFGEPNDAGVAGREQHLALDFGGRCWNDEGSAISIVHGYVAETPVPEPATLLLVGSTMAGLGMARWKRRRRLCGARV